MLNELNKFFHSRKSSISADEDLFKFLNPENQLIANEQELDIDIVLNKESTTYICKVILLGDAGVGKTSIQNSYVYQKFYKDYFVTIGTGLAIKNQQIGSHHIQFQIWDIAGQPQFHELRKSYYSSATAGIVVCDVTNPKTMDNIPIWIYELWKHNGKGPIPIVLVSNKIDLQDVNLNLSQDEILSNFIEKINTQTLCHYGFKNSYLPVSAKVGTNIDKIFKEIGVHVIVHRHSLKRMQI